MLLLGFLTAYPLFSQHTFIDSLDFGNSPSVVFQVNAFDTPGEYALLNIGINVLIYNKTHNTIKNNPHFFGTSFEAETGPVFLLRSSDGLYNFGPLGLTWVHSLGGSNNFPFQHIHTSDGTNAFFRYRDKELWRTNGTAPGTALWREFDEEIIFLHTEGDTLHCITGGAMHLHYAIHKLDSGQVVHPMPGTITSRRIFEGHKLELRGLGANLYHQNWLFYSLLYRSVTEIQNALPAKISASTMKEQGGWYYGSRWSTGNHRARLDLGSIQRVHFEQGVTELLVETDSIYHGILAVYPLSPDKTVVLGSISSHSGAEVYALEPDFGLEQLKEIYPGRAGSMVYNLGSSGLSLAQYNQAVEHGGYLYFTANSPEHGAEMWRTDGTTAGTKRFSNFVEGPGGVSWISYFTLGDDLYAVTKHHYNRLEFYKIDTSFQGFDEENVNHEDATWDRYLLRHGPSHEDYMSPLREPRLYKTADGFVGLLQGFRTNLNYRDKWIDVSGTYEMRIPHVPSSKNGNMLYWLDEAGLVEKSIFIMAETDKTDLMHLPESDDLILTFEHRDWTSIGDYRIEQPGLSTGLARMNAQGEVLWHKLFNAGGTTVRVVNFTAHGDHTYLTGTYAYPAIHFGDEVSLSTEYNQQFFVACFDGNGAPAWAVNTSMEGLSRFSNLGQIAVDAERNRLYTTYSEHTLNTWNSCAFGDWKVRINALNLQDGSPIWMNDIAGDDMIRVRDIAVDKLGQLWMLGNFRGEMTLGQNKFVAGGENNCPHNAFTLTLKGQDGNFQHFHSTDEIHKRGRKLMPMGDYMDAVYLNAFWDPEDALPPLRHRRVSYLEKSRFSLTGRMLGNERFPTPRGVYFGGYDNDEDGHIKAAMCDAGDGHYVLMLANYRYGLLGLGDRQAAPYLFGKSATTILKRKHPEFLLPAEVIDKELAKADFIVIPNPTYDLNFRVMINPGMLSSFDKIKVYDLHGKLIMAEVLNREYYSSDYRLPGHIIAGVYVVSLEGPNIRQAQRLVVIK